MGEDMPHMISMSPPSPLEHRPGSGSQTLVVTDSLISIPEDPPELLMDAQ